MTRECDGCKFCCWSFNVDVPHPHLYEIVELKRELRHCHHECEAGCALHSTKHKPTGCQSFHCPFVLGDAVHRPDLFQEFVKQLDGTMGNYIPIVPDTINVEAAQDIIRKTRSLPAAILLNSTWVKLILPMDRSPDGTWRNNQGAINEWADFYAANNCDFPKELMGIRGIVNE